MIKGLYIFFSVLIGIKVLEGIPFLDVLSGSWHIVSTVALRSFMFLALFLVAFNTAAFMEEKDNHDSSFVQFYLRQFIGLKLLPLWPLYFWFGAAAFQVQVNNVIDAVAIFIITLLATSVVLVQNGLYKRFLMEEVKK
ncbi:hypothetical protein SEPL_487 [Salmonella phage SE_PL]|nr:hypothetical protein [Salmonella enterica]ELL7856331.1 hypothetical protein [Salmonella enterica]QCW18585.1 hypothetical protein 7t3_064 [Salmonella phage 7t3]QIG63100.1 hypothetical protein SEPL_487 [Salmonella phage SE_PL]WNV47564.1 hypothetical protein [Klebsiella phage fENko-Kae01]